MRVSFCVEAFFIFLCLQGIFCSPSGNLKTQEFDLANGVQACLEEPVVVSLSQINEKRWGFHQFVSMSPYPGDRILLRFHVGEDAVKAYGTASPTFISSDKGTSWQPFSANGLPASGLTCPLFNGHFICLTPAKPLNLKKEGLRLPAPVSKLYAYTWYFFYRLDECPFPVQNFFVNLDAARWTPKTKEWRHDGVQYDSTNALIWTLAEGEQSDLIARTTFERPPLHFNHELLYADYRTNYLNADGAVPKHWRVACMVSQDNGKSWHHRSTIEEDQQSDNPLTEPMLAENVKGELVCVIRRTDHRQKSMLITFSQDRGETWEKPVALAHLGEFGVMPCVLRLECGVMVLSYGRPGVWLSFSLDGTGREWTKPVCVLAGDTVNVQSNTDGYTSMLPIGPDQLLLAYTDFNHQDAQGNQHKAVLVRKLRVKVPGRSVVFFSDRWRTYPFLSVNDGKVF